MMKSYTISRVPGTRILDLAEGGQFLIWPSGMVTIAKHYPLVTKEDTLAYIAACNE